MPTTEPQLKTPTNWLAIHLGSRALQQLPISKLRDITQIQRNGNQTCRAHTTSAREGNETQEKCAPHQPQDHPPESENGGFPKERGRKEPDRGKSFHLKGKKKKAGSPGHGKQPVLAEKRQTEREGPLLGKAEGRHFPGSGLESLAPGSRGR